MPRAIEDPILAYTAAEGEINQIQWGATQPDWIAICYNKALEILRVWTVSPVVLVVCQRVWQARNHRVIVVKFFYYIYMRETNVIMVIYPVYACMFFTQWFLFYLFILQWKETYIVFYVWWRCPQTNSWETVLFSTLYRLWSGIPHTEYVS
jgi:hypothetical protein